MDNILKALRGELTYDDKKRQRQVGINPSTTVIWNRVRGLHLSQGGIFGDELMSASLFDVASLCFRVKLDQLKHPLCVYIPKSESAEEALWWRDLFQAICDKLGWPKNYIKCMALVESHPLAFQMEEFLYNLRDHILGLNLGRWDYMASLGHFNLNDPDLVLPDRNTIPHDVPFFQNLRDLIPEICHKRGALAIGGMTALYPSREDPELNARALAGPGEGQEERGQLPASTAPGPDIPTRTRSPSISSPCPTRIRAPRPTSSAIPISGHRRAALARPP